MNFVQSRYNELNSIIYIEHTHKRFQNQYNTIAQDRTSLILGHYLTSDFQWVVANVTSNV